MGKFFWESFFKTKKQSSDKTGLNRSEAIDPQKLPKHIAIIMDGNGRWAKKKGMPRAFGHRAGAKTLRSIVRAASDMNIKVLTVYAFSTENWNRPQEEIDMLMNLFSEYLDNEVEELHQNKVQIRFIGVIDKLSKNLQDKFEKTQVRTANNTGLILNVAVNYGGRAEMTRAVQIIAEEVKNGRLTSAQITAETIEKYLYTAGLPDPDLLIRPSGDYRISNYLLWQLAYAELWFTEINWPDFKPEHLVEAIIDYQKRERRFGGLLK